MRVTTTTQPPFPDLLTIEAVTEHTFRSVSLFEEPVPIYGGQLTAQALRAAGSTVESEKVAHSFHCYFLRPGDTARPVEYRVERERDGRSFSSRRIVATQNGRAILSMIASFHVPAEGPDRQAEPAPEVSSPEESGFLAEHYIRLTSLEFREPRPAPAYTDEGWPTRLWIRAPEPLVADRLGHACAMTYLTDVSTGISDWSTGKPGTGVSLDHAVWFHRAVPFDDWIMLDLAPRSGADGRGLYTGRLYRRDGLLIASFAQETLLP